jgi:hypothetical protein
MYRVVSWIAVVVGLFFFTSAIVSFIENFGTFGMVMGAIYAFTSLLLITVGIFLNKNFQRKLARRHSLTQFGKVSTVDSRTFKHEEEDKTCIECGSTVSQGLLRRYRKEFVFAGIPLSTIHESKNTYCVNCSLEEPSTDGRSFSRMKQKNIEK